MDTELDQSAWDERCDCGMEDGLGEIGRGGEE